jgi:hypothetical protein
VKIEGFSTYKNENLLRVTRAEGGYSSDDLHLSSIVSRAIDKFWERRGMTSEAPFNPYRNYSKTHPNESKERILPDVQG